MEKQDQPTKKKKRQPWAAKNLGKHAINRFDEPMVTLTVSGHSQTTARLQAIAQQHGVASASELLEYIGRGEISIECLPDMPRRSTTSFRVTDLAKAGLQAIARQNRLSISGLVTALGDGGIRAYGTNYTLANGSQKEAPPQGSQVVETPEVTDTRRGSQRDPL